MRCESPKPLPSTITGMRTRRRDRRLILAATTFTGPTQRGDSFRWPTAPTREDGWQPFSSGNPRQSPDSLGKGASVAECVAPKQLLPFASEQSSPCQESPRLTNTPPIHRTGSRQRPGRPTKSAESADCQKRTTPRHRTTRFPPPRSCSTVRTPFQLLENQRPPDLFQTVITMLSAAPGSPLSVIVTCSVAFP